MCKIYALLKSIMQKWLAVRYNSVGKTGTYNRKLSITIKMCCSRSFKQKTLQILCIIIGADSCTNNQMLEVKTGELSHLLTEDENKT